jgi:hypothetical protein
MIPENSMGRARVLLGYSVYEDADLTINDGHLFIEFDGESLDSVTVDLRPLNLCQGVAAERKRILSDETLGRALAAVFAVNSPDNREALRRALLKEQ